MRIARLVIRRHINFRDMSVLSNRDKTISVAFNRGLNSCPFYRFGQERDILKMLICN